MFSPYSAENVYKINYSNPGTVVIFNNKDFKDENDDKSNKDRLGSEKDVEKLEMIFKKLNYFVNSHINTTAKEMKDLIKMYADRDHKESSCFICFVMSHGTKQRKDKWYIKGSDWENVNVYNEIINAFKSTKTLINKPKLFFIQACRGVATFPVETNLSDKFEIERNMLTIKSKEKIDFSLSMDGTTEDRIKSSELS